MPRFATHRGRYSHGRNYRRRFGGRVWRFPTTLSMGSFGHFASGKLDDLMEYFNAICIDEERAPSRFGTDWKSLHSNAQPRSAERKPDPALLEDLQIEKVDFQVAQNVRNHHTDEYDITEGSDPQLVIRRGNEFTITIDFSRPYSKERDDLRLVFQIGDQPKPSKSTHVELVLSAKDVPGQWGAKVASQLGNSLTLTIFTPPDCIVGKWRFKVHVVKKQDDKTTVFRYIHKDPLYMLFNPWCKEDAVYVEREIERQAYVLDDKGKVFVGSKTRISGKPWVFGQFSGQVLDCCMYLLDMSELNVAVRGNPIPVIRKLCAMVNSQDDDGVLTGNWSGDYSGGASPLSWTGSAAILEQFYAQKNPVEFGQCWVFSGVLTTVFRALGIAARSVTNFASAHDVDTSITIDMHYNKDGEPLEDLNEDSVWNFHVWNEVWVARPDLPSGYGGWQACDATPQETSDGVYCCGPCPVRAIKEGEVNLPYDGPFIFAEVNADKVYWIMQDDGSSEMVHVEKNVVGKNISTLSLTGEREDVTCRYKYPEDSSEERVAVRRANQVGSSRRDIYKEGPKDVTFDLGFDSDSTFVGQDFEMVLKCCNNSQEDRSITGRTSISSMYYTGVVSETIAKEPFYSFKLSPKQTKEIKLKVSAEQYQKYLKDGCMLSLSAMARVEQTKQIFTKLDDTRLRKPHLRIKVGQDGKVGQEFEVEVSFTNPLPFSLTDCYLQVEGPGITKAQKYPQGDVPPKGTFLSSFKLKPAKGGKRQIVVIFNSRQLEDINGSYDMQISA